MRQPTTQMLLAAVALAFSILAISGPVAVAQDADADEQLHQDIATMLQLTRSDQIADQVFRQVLAQMKKLVSGVPDEFWAEVESEVDTSALIDELIPIYARHLSHDDITAAIAFYESAAGQNLVTALPQIV